MELADIRIIDETGNYVSGGEIYAYQTVTPQYVYKNNTDCTVYVQGYNWNFTQISGIYAIPAYGTITINGEAKTVASNGTFSVWGGVYLEGAGRGNTSWETTGDNNYLQKYWIIKSPLSIDYISPNANYRENLQVVTSFKVHNAVSKNFIPNDGVTVKFTIWDGSNLIYESSKDSVVVPGKNENLVYFKWTVPSGYALKTLTIKVGVYKNGKLADESSFNQIIFAKYSSQTTDTKYEASKPSRWMKSSVPEEYCHTATWSEWVYWAGHFIKKAYGINISQGSIVTATPDTNAPSVNFKNGLWSMKSGYGYEICVYPTTTTALGMNRANADSYTPIQTVYTTFPEFNYSSASGKYRVLENTGGCLKFRQNPVANNLRLHYVPIWYPDTDNYTASCYMTDFWTPSGMLTARLNANSFVIKGNMYDDWFIGR